MRLAKWLTCASIVVIVVLGTVPANAGTTELAVSQPRIDVVPTDSSITGWGIGSTKLVITVSGVPSPEGLEVTLDAENGTVDPNPVVLDAQGRGETTLRSTNAEQATIAAVGPEDVRSASITVNFEQPWGFLALAGAAGLGGAFLRRKGRRHSRRAIVIGAFSASAVTLAQQVGLTNWVAAVSGTERYASSGGALVFVIGALAALAGVTLLVPGAGQQQSTH
jgi:hypothetical protein